MATLLDWTPFIDSLPTNRFFWYDRVRPENKARYLHLLDQLYTLFITPHLLPNPPYLTCSFLKTMQQLFSYSFVSSLYLKCIIDLLSHGNNPELFVNPETFVQIQVEGKKYFALFSFKDYLQKGVDIYAHNPFKDWYENRCYKTLLIPVSYNTSGVTEAHATFLAVRKMGFKKLQFMYVDSLGYSETDFDIKTSLQNSLKLWTGIDDLEFEDTLLSCPVLQTVEQGGNCAQWSYLYLALFISQPDMFSNLPAVLQDLFQNPMLNVHLFSLSIFLRTMPVVGLDTYLNYTFTDADRYDLCNMENLITTLEVTRQFGVPNCYFNRSCPAPCVNYNNYCMFKVAAEETEQRPLTPQEIAQKMFQLYTEILTLTD